MIVIDASAVVELLLNSRAGRQVAARVAETGETLHAPHLVAIEVTQVLRRSVAGDALDSGRAVLALGALSDLRIEHYPHEILLPRVWSLRENMTAYDAAYVALAEALDAPLLTLDARLAKAPGHAAEVELISNTAE